MARRKSHKKRGTPAPAMPAKRVAAAPPPATPPPAKVPAADGPPVVLGEAPTDRLAWRTRMLDLLEDVRAWGRLHYAKALDRYLRERFGEPDAIEHADDIPAATDDFVCAPGSAGDGASILQVYCQQTSHTAADSVSGQAPSPDELSQVARWDRERRRGVFILQRAQRDRLSLWDPLEGAPITLHLLRKQSDAQAEALVRGAVVTAAFQPWMARLVAVSTECFLDPQAVQLFREQTVEASRTWHEAPAPAPEKKRSTLSKS